MPLSAGGGAADDNDGSSYLFRNSSLPYIKRVNFENLKIFITF
jgi:hypothetical protein